MPRHAVVIGGGAIGVAAAHFLVQSGWQVTLVERGEIGGGCSHANACLIVPSHSHPLPGPGVLGQGIRWMARADSPLHVRPRLDPAFLRWVWQFRRFCSSEPAERGFHALLQLSRASLDLYDALARTPGLEFFYRRDGLLHVYLTDEALEAARGEGEALDRSGFRARLLSRDATLEFEPALGPQVRGGLFIEGEAHGDCLGYVRALARGVEARGARLATGRAVSRILVQKGRAVGVRTEGIPTWGVGAQGADTAGVRAGDPVEEIRADLVVLAAGAWSPALAAPLGFHIPVQPAKGYSCTIRNYPGSPAVPVLVHEKRVIVTPLGDRLRLAGTLELAGFDLRLTGVRYQAVVRAGRQVLNDAFRLDHEEAWCGLRPLTPDGLPVIGPAPGIEGLIVATGHAMLGFTQSPITGRLVAEIADGKTPSVTLDPFRPGRFARSREVRSSS